jgi:hypothetical protein
MAPERDEIVKHLDDGFSVAWDTTRLDKGKLQKVDAVGQTRAAELGRIVGAADIRIEQGDLIMTVEVKQPTAARGVAPRRRRSRAAS